MASVVGSWGKTPDLSGTLWPITHGPIGVNQKLLIFAGGWCRGQDSSPSLSVSSTVRFNDAFPEYLLRGVLFEVAGPRAAGTINVNWSANGCSGSAFFRVINAGEFDIGSGPLRDSSQNVWTRTLGALNASTDNSVRFEYVITALNREPTNGPLDEIFEASYTSSSTGGVGGGVGNKAVSSGSTTGDEWVFVDPDKRGQANAGASPSVGWAVIYKDASSSSTNPILSGTINAPDGASATAPGTPSMAPTVVASNSTTLAITPNDLDSTATTFTIEIRKKDGAGWSTPFTIGPFPINSPMPVLAEFLIPGSTYSVRSWVTRDGVNSTNSSPWSAEVKLPQSVVHIFVDPSAVGVSGVEVQIWKLPPAGTSALVGAVVHFSKNMTFDSSLVDGRARMVIPLVTTASVTTGEKLAAVCCRRGVAPEIWTRIMYDATVVSV